jgi:hypothetical protein
LHHFSWIFVSVEDKLRRTQIDNAKSQQAIRRSKRLTLGTKAKLANSKQNKPRKSDDVPTDEARSEDALEQAAEIRRQAREIRQKSREVYAKSKQVRLSLEQRRNGSS